MNALLVAALLAADPPDRKAAERALDTVGLTERVLPAQRPAVDAGTVVAPAPSAPPRAPVAREPREPAPDEVSEVTFAATLLEVPRMPEARDTGKVAWPIGDAHWLVRLKVDELSTGHVPFKKGDTVTFLVHSPAMLFEGSAAASKRYAFTATCEWRNGKPRFVSLHLE